ncbi:hypothetical protein [Streptomyces sp. NPDC051219]|uniref:hypothetical protein n=1 Tax=Streptomyces sp. NPDC051219 TaxID=3155283 RepID=UPI003412810C
MILRVGVDSRQVVERVNALGRSGFCEGMPDSISECGVPMAPAARTAAQIARAVTSSPRSAR